MPRDKYIERLVTLLDPDQNVFLNATAEEATTAMASGDTDQIRALDGQFALVYKEGQTVRMARSIGRPMRYFLAKRAEGPCLVVAERIDEIQEFLEREGLSDQFHPSYTRMVPAHHVTELELVGCPDPKPSYTRYFDPNQATLPPDLDAIGKAYIGSLADECQKWLGQVDDEAPIGVPFSGGIDSGSIFLVLHHLLLERGEAPTRLKAFTLSVEGGSDVEQAYEFLEELGLSMFLEVVETAKETIDFREAIRVTEDYKPLDVQAATMTLALCRSIRERYPNWTYLVDGDGGDENLKDYPIDAYPELTIRSVLNNQMLYQEGWGVDALKHSSTYSGGQSRGHVRSYAPARHFDFQSFSPYTLPNMIEVAENIPFVELTDWEPERLYQLKGEVVRRGLKAVTGQDMPIFEKTRFQRGAVAEDGFDDLFPEREQAYRRAFSEIHE